MSTTTDELREEVRRRYAESARAVTGGSGGGCASGSCCAGDTDAAKFGEALYDAEQRGELPNAAVLASLGCGNPTAVADLREGETVLDLGSGGGIDVILSAKRVGPSGIAYGLDMTDEMLALARRNAADAAGREQDVGPAAGAEIEHRLTRPQVGKRRRAGAAERRRDGRLRQRRPLGRVVDLLAHKRIRAAAADVSRGVGVCILDRGMDVDLVRGTAS